MADSNFNIQILYEDNHLLVVEKPVNILMQADDTNDQDLLKILKQYLVEKYHKPGDAFLGLVHRLDRPVGGVVVFAKTSKAASRLSNQIRLNKMHKTYLAVVTGEPESSRATLRDYLYKDSATNTVTVVNPLHDDAKEAILRYQVLADQNGLSLVQIELVTGRPHQIRVQFASRNHPLWGDQRYNKQAVTGQQIALWAASLSFIHPTTLEPLSFTLATPDRFPFNQFTQKRPE
ncbi:Ribosomal large subunit pseudouridine synthase C [bioreactor metagenome]|uniref:Ribosomal large subunit pseudouridine synthase C n=1 Tax=bioreactor metagenome TaxID=1076179 RepID=A0A645B0A7_9ZZZZ